MSTNSTNQATFSILDHEDKLVEAETKGRYHCPACDENNFTFNKETGAYQCWSGCTSEQIREALSPRNDRQQSGQGTQPPRTEVPKGKRPKPVTLPDKLDSATRRDLPDSLPRQQRNDREHGQVWEIIYIYSETQDVTRTEWMDSTKPKGYSKVCIPYHLDAEGQVKRGKGEAPWPLYRQQEALEHGKGKWIFIPEGEPCVEALRRLGLIGVTFQGADWQPQIINERLSELKEAGIAGIIILPDNDDPGRKKANRVVIEANKIGLPQLLIEPLELWEEMPDKGDIVDWIEWGTANGMNTEDFRQRLEEVFKEVAGRRKEAEREAREEPKTERSSHQHGSTNPPGLDRDNLISPAAPERATLEALIYHKLFGGRAGEYNTIDDTYYRDTNKGYWSKVPDSRIFSLIGHKSMQAFHLNAKNQPEFGYGTNAKLESSFKFCRKTLDVGEIPANRHLRCFSNCTVDLRTGEAMPHDRNHFLTTSIAADYIPNQSCPEVFVNFIKSALGEEQLDAVRAYTSMLLDPTAPYGKFAHLIGPSGSGKGTLLRLWGELFSLEHFRSGDFSNLSTADKRHQYLTGAALYAVPDCGGYQQGLKPFYELVDNGPMSGRALFSSNGYQKKWDMRFVIASVEHLTIENSGDGWNRRCLPFLFKIRQGIEDPELGNKLAEVKGQIISWALAMPRSERDRLLLCPSTNEQIQQNKLEAAIHGDPARAFIDMCFRPSSGAPAIAGHELHSWFKAYADAHGYQNWGYSKLISHLKTILPHHYVDRRFLPREKGIPRGKIDAHWINMEPRLGAFINLVGSDENAGTPADPIWRCDKSKCVEGGLVDFMDFKPKLSGSAGSAGSVTTQIRGNVDDPTVEQGFQDFGSAGSVTLGGGVLSLGDDLGEEEKEKEKEKENISTGQCSSPHPPTDPTDPTDPAAETIATALPVVDQPLLEVTDPERVADPASESPSEFKSKSQSATTEAQPTLGAPVPQRLKVGDTVQCDSFKSPMIYVGKSLKIIKILGNYQGCTCELPDGTLTSDLNLEDLTPL